MLPLLPNAPRTMDPYRETRERCTVRRCSVPAWPVLSLCAPTPLTAANSVQVRGVGTEASWGQIGPFTPCPGRGDARGGWVEGTSQLIQHFLGTTLHLAWSQGSKDVHVSVGYDGF